MKILSIVCGGISCYKYIDFARMMMKNHNAIITTILTKSAQDFITPLLISSTTQNQCYTQDTYKMEHITLSRDVDFIIVFSATANFISSVASGLSGNLALDTILAKKQDTPIILCPAMNPQMWTNPIIQENIVKLQKYNYLFCMPEDGTVACGESGVGKLCDINTISEFIVNLKQQKLISKDKKKVIITTGSTIEKIDDVRYISNFSSGLQGVLIENCFAKHNFDVVLIKGKIDESLNNKISTNIKTVSVLSAKDMFDACIDEIENKDRICDVFISVAAVCDFYVENYQSGKIKKNLQDKNQNPALILKQNPDILKTIGNLTNKRPKIVVGFAAEEFDLLEENARKKIITINEDIIIANAIC